MQDQINEWVRGSKHQKRGVLVAVKSDEEEGVVHIGWSLCKIKAKGKKVDKFDPQIAIDIARGRAVSGFSATYLPHSLQKQMNHFVDRAKRYFKGATVIVIDGYISNDSIETIDLAID